MDGDVIDWSDFDRELLAAIFAQLPFRLMGVVSLVCRRWSLVAADPHWKPDLVVYAWGEAHVTGLEHACARPTLLEFSLQQPVVQIACANEATLALTASGDVWRWGICCTRPSPPDYALETCAQPRRVRSRAQALRCTVGSCSRWRAAPTRRARARSRRQSTLAARPSARTRTH